MINQEHIHTPDDGRGARSVFVNGKKMQFVTYADTKRGIVTYSPVLCNKRHEFGLQTRRGKVEVCFI